MKHRKPKIRLVPWDLCTVCKSTDGIHAPDCPAVSTCVRVGCGRPIEGDGYSEMSEDGLCRRCTETFITECLVREAQDADHARDAAQRVRETTPEGGNHAQH